MKNIYNKYRILKENDSEKLYLFESGIFLITICEDATFLSRLLHLKLIPFNKETFKCGFPLKVKDKYLEALKNYNIDYEIIDEDNAERLIKRIDLKTIDIEKINPDEAYNILKKLCLEQKDA